MYELHLPSRFSRFTLLATGKSRCAIDPIDAHGPGFRVTQNNCSVIRPARCCRVFGDRYVAPLPAQKYTVTQKHGIMSREGPRRCLVERKRKNTKTRRGNVVGIRWQREVQDAWCDNRLDARDGKTGHDWVTGWDFAWVGKTGAGSLGPGRMWSPTEIIAQSLF